MGTFEYMLVISREAKVVVGVRGVCDIWLIRSVEVDTLNAYGRGKIGWFFDWRILQACRQGRCASWQRDGWGGLVCVLWSSPLWKVRRDLSLSFHLKLGGMRLGLWFIVFLTWLWNVFVGLNVDARKLFVSMNSIIFLLYWCMGKMTMEFPLLKRSWSRSWAWTVLIFRFWLLGVCFSVEWTCGVFQCS